MTSAGHEYYDYNRSQLEKEAKIRQSYTGTGNDFSVNEWIRKQTRDFEKGLLLLYPIADAGALTKEKGDHKTPFGFAVVFPDRKGKGKLQAYRMNDVAVEKDCDEFYG